MIAAKMLGVLLSIACSAASGAEYFVATTGDDSNPGTASAPFATLERARTAVRARLAARPPANGVAVTIRGGTYRRTGTLVLTGADSGTAASPVVWRAYPGETVRLSGGRPVTGWTAVTAGDPSWSRLRAGATIYRANVGLTGSALIADFLPLTSWAATAAGDPEQARVGSSSSAVPFQGDQGVNAWRPHPKLAELIFDGQMMKLARWPERSDDPSVATSWLKATPGVSRTQFASGSSVAGRGWVELSTLPDVNKPWAHVVGGGYHDDVLQMTGASGRTIRVATAPAEGIDGSSSQGRWAALNLLEELSDPGEYWIDRAAGVVYFRPPGDAAPAAHETVVSELTAPLVWADEAAHHITFDGLTFEATQSFLVRLAGAHLTVRGCTFRNAGGSGVLVGGERATIEGSRFHDLAGAGVVLVGVDVRHMPARGSSHATIEGNEIHRTGRYAFNKVPAITMGGGTGHRLAHNHIHDVPGMGVYMLSVGATIEYNLFQRTGLHGFDHGALYAWNNRNASTTIRYNVFRDVRMNATYPATRSEGYIVAGIYCDDHASGYTTHSNVFFNFVASPTCRSCNVTPAIVNKTAGNSFRNSIFANVSQIYYGTDGARRGGPYVSRNQAWTVNRGFPPGAVDNVIADPRFVDPSAGDFSNQPDGTAVVVNGTEPIPAARIGPARAGAHSTSLRP